MSDELAQFLATVDNDNAYRVDEVLKHSAFEETQRVSKRNVDGSFSGPYIRKIFKADSGLGSAYEHIKQAQDDGYVYPHLPRVYECYRLKDSLIVVMELVEGKTLQECIYEQDPSLGLTCRVFPSICDAVLELHQGFSPSIIHRDLKPSNIILNEQRCVLIDFGIARVFHEGSEGDTQHFGTRQYAPPEQFGFGQTDIRSDVYSLGLLLYYCLTEENPTLAIRQAGFKDKRIPVALQEVIRKATQFDPAVRYANVEELKAAFLEAMQGISALNGSAAGDLKAKVPSENYLRTLLNQASSKFKQLSSAIPTWVGVSWNVAILLIWLFMMAVCVIAVVEPTPENAQLPLWLLVFEFPVFMGLIFSGAGYLFLDKRRLRQRFGVLQKLRGIRSGEGEANNSSRSSSVSGSAIRFFRRNLLRRVALLL